MDSHQSFPFNWGNHGPAYNQHGNGQLEGPQHIASSSFTFKPPSLHAFQAGISNDFQSNDDIPMIGIEEKKQIAPPVSTAPPRTGFSRRAKGEQLDWNAHKGAIRSLYIEQNKSLSETMQAMEKDHSFKASQKIYKTMFKEWKWQKNLSTEAALVMAEKANRRKREEGKDTVFVCGGKVWGRDRIDSTLARVKRARFNENLADAATPQDVSYETPKALVDFPSAKYAGESPDVERIEISDDEPEDSFSDPTHSRPTKGSKFKLTWHGYPTADFPGSVQTGVDHRDAGRPNEVEDILHEVLLDMSYVMSSMTSEDMIKVAYNLADLYAGSNRMNEAIAMVEKVMKCHLTTCGCEGPRSQQDVSRAVELLNDWNRQTYALSLPSLSKELLQTSSNKCKARKAKRQPNKMGKGAERPTPIDSGSGISKAMHSVLEKLYPLRVNYGLGVVPTHVAVRDGAAQDLLLAIIFESERNPELAVQHIKAQAELLKLYDKLREANEHGADFEGALASLDKTWGAYSWKEDPFESLVMMEAGLQLVAISLKCGYRIHARRMFREASDKASTVFGPDDERTIWVLITIGLVYQNFMTWDDAEEWFEQALAAALAHPQWDPRDGIVESLQNAMDQKHCPNFINKGKPFRTIVGINGIMFRSWRLHLE